MTDFFDEEGNKVAVEIEVIKKLSLERAEVATVEVALLDQNDLGYFGRWSTYSILVFCNQSNMHSSLS